jgi:hypothetical protein
MPSRMRWSEKGRLVSSKLTFWPLLKRTSENTAM